MNTSDFKILIVDDEDIVRINLTAFFEDENFDVVSVDSGESALNLLNSKTIDAGIIDIRLPGMDGTELILKAAERQPQMKFIIHTGSADFTLSQNLLDLGITEEELFRKPMADMDMLTQAIYRLLKIDH